MLDSIKNNYKTVYESEENGVFLEVNGRKYLVILSTLPNSSYYNDSITIINQGDKSKVTLNLKSYSGLASMAIEETIVVAKVEDVHNGRAKANCSFLY